MRWPWETKHTCLSSPWFKSSGLLQTHKAPVMKTTSEYISIGANRSSSCAICTQRGRTAFGAGRFVALWDAQASSPKSIDSSLSVDAYQSTSRGVRRTLKGHNGQVTTLKVVREDDEACVLVSGDSTGEIRIWTIDSADTVRPALQLASACDGRLRYGSIPALHSKLIKALSLRLALPRTLVR